MVQTKLSELDNCPQIVNYTHFIRHYQNPKLGKRSALDRSDLARA